MNIDTRQLSIGQCATSACLLEVAAPKPGNVHRGADFSNLTLNEFLLSAEAIAPAMENAVNSRVGQTVLNAIQATRRFVDTNTNLGTVLLLTPLATVARDRPIDSGVADVLSNLSEDDARDVYEAIRIAEPGGMGKVDEMDISAPPPTDLLRAMTIAADRDLVARQYATNFQFVLDFVTPSICAGYERGWSLPHTIIHAQLKILAEHEDSLVARKCGPTVAQDVSRRAGVVLSLGSPGDEAYDAALADFDFWLRCDGNRRNPGTTADLIAAGLFVVFRDSLIKPPYHHQL